MPWCDSCDKYLAPSAAKADGSCPDCGTEVDVGDTVAQVEQPVPWHFWIVVVALVAYLGWRLVDGARWVLERT